MRIPHVARLPLFALPPLLSLACEQVIAPSFGDVEITIATSGRDLDPDGYHLRVGRMLAEPVGIDDTISIRDLPAGTYAIQLSGLALNCGVATVLERTVTIAAGKTARVHLAVDCTAFAALHVSVATHGHDLDPNGYTLVAEGLVSGLVGHVEHGMLLLTGTVAGPHAVTLADVSPNCEVEGGTRRDVELMPGDTARLTFVITCEVATLIAFATDDDQHGADIHVIRSNGSGRLRLTTHPGPDGEPAWSPDGNRLAFVRERDGNAEIHVMMADGTGEVRLTTDPGSDRSPDWSPDGSRIVFVSDRDGNDELYLVNADGSDLVRLTHDPASDRDPAWSPDGQVIAFVRDEEVGSGVFGMGADGSNVRRLVGATRLAANPAWSPDMTQLAYTHRFCATEECPPLIHVARIGRSGAVIAEGDHATWSPDGRRIAYARTTCGWDYWDYYGPSSCLTHGLWAVTVAGTDAVQLAPGSVSGIAWRRSPAAGIR